MAPAPGQYDVAIAGAGMVGAATAALLARCGFSVTVIEARQPAPFDPAQPVGLRVSAISPGSAAVLEQAGAWRAIGAARACAYRRMRVEDGAGERAAALEFEAPAFGMERLGTIVENDLVQSVLWSVLEGAPLVALLCPARLVALDTRDDGVVLSLDDGRALAAQLLIGADGAMSAVRRLAGIGQDTWDYNQQGLVCVVRKTEPNPGVAWQRFLPGGPLAFLPLADGSSSIVWTVGTREAGRLLALDDEGFAAELEAASAGWLGAVAECGPRAAFPLAMRLSRRYVGDRVVLLGDAAHAVHPLAGQGVNLGLADAAALVETLAKIRFGARDAGRGLADRGALRRFERWRRSESELMAGGMHALRALFMPGALASIRGLGLGLVGRSWLAREAFLRRAAGTGRNAPRLARGEGLQALMRGS